MIYGIFDDTDDEPKMKFCPNCGAKMYLKDIGPIDHIRDLLQAEKDGQLVVLPKENAEFLENLRHELLTQPTDGNCDPRFWGVIEETIEWGYNEECGEGGGVFDSEMCCDVGEPDDLQALMFIRNSTSLTFRPAAVL